MTGRQRAAFGQRDAFVLVGLVFYWPFLTIGTSVHNWAEAALRPASSGLLVHSFATDYSLMLVAVFVALFALRGRLAPLIEKNSVLAWPFAALGSIGCALLAMAGSLGGAGLAACVAGAACVCLFVGMFTLLWGERTSRADIVRLLLVVLISASISRVIVALFYVIGVDLAPVLIACPLLSALFMALAGKQEPTGSRALGVHALADVPWGIVAPTVLLLAATSVVAQVVTGYDLGTAGLASHMMNVALVIVACTGMGVGVVRMRTPDDLLLVFCGVFVACAGLLLLVLLVPSLIDLSIGLRICLATFLWVVFAYTCASRRVSALPLFCVYGVLCVAVLGVRLFDHAGLIRILAESQLGLAVAGVLAFVASSAAVVVFVARSRRRPREAARRDEDWQRDLCERACANVGLTAREAEIVTLAYRGFSARGTAEQLVLSEHTVKNHLANAYRKLDVHSRQELIEFIDAHRT